MGSSNNLFFKSFKMSAIHMTRKAIFERFYLVSGQQQLAPVVTMPSAPTSPVLNVWLFLNFSPNGRSNFCQNHLFSK